MHIYLGVRNIHLRVRYKSLLLFLESSSATENKPHPMHTYLEVSTIHLLESKPHFKPIYLGINPMFIWH